MAASRDGSALQRNFWRWLFRRAERRDFAGVHVAFHWPEPDEAVAGFAKCAEALELLARFDPRRLERIRRHADGILLFGSVGGLAQWVAPARVIVLRGTYVLAPETSAAELASTLVHEGTHAWLESLGISYEPDRRERIEAICFHSELAFARRIPDGGDLVARAGRQLQRAPEYWADAAFRARTMADLRTLGTPKWLVWLLEQVFRHRVA